MIRIHASELLRLAETPMPWWDREARPLLGLVVPGDPSPEMVYADGDNVGTPTGWYILAFPDSARDEYVLEVIRKRWEILDGDDDDAIAMVNAQIVQDWASWEVLEAEIIRLGLPSTHAVERIWEYIQAQGVAIGIPYVAPVESEDEEETEDP